MDGTVFGTGEWEGLSCRKKAEQQIGFERTPLAPNKCHLLFGSNWCWVAIRREPFVILRLEMDYCVRSP